MLQKIRSVFKNHYVLSVCSSGTTAFLGFATFAVLARWLDAEIFGKWLIFTTICTFFDLVRTGFLQTAVIKFTSGQTGKNLSPIFGSIWILALGTTVLSTLGVLVAIGIGKWFSLFQEYQSYLYYIPLVHWFTLPFNVSTWRLQSESKFISILIVRGLNLGSFCILALYGWYLGMGEIFLMWGFILSNALASGFCLLMGWTGIEHLFSYSKQKMQLFFQFGKYNMGTMIAANLVRISDPILIGMVLGPKAVAIFSVPFKLIDIIDIPLRSMVMASQPKLAKLASQKSIHEFKLLYLNDVSLVTLLLSPLLMVCFLFAEPLVEILGGSQYVESANLLRIFMIYVAIMPLDRFSGVSLDLLNKPHLNFIKVLSMLVINIIGDLAAMYGQGEVWSVACVSILTFGGGAIMGIYYLNQMISFRMDEIAAAGIRQMQNLHPAYILKRLRK